MTIDRSWRRIAWIILVIGGLIMAGGLALGWGSLRHVLWAERTEGEVVEIRREGDMYAPSCAFAAPTARCRRSRTSAAAHPTSRSAIG